MRSSCEPSPDKEDALSMVTAGATANTTEGNSRVNLITSYALPLKTVPPFGGKKGVDMRCWC